MQYRSGRQGESISILGYGCMRFTRTRGAIDLGYKAQREVTAAIASRRQLSGTPPTSTPATRPPWARS